MTDFEFPKRLSNPNRRRQTAIMEGLYRDPISEEFEMLREEYPALELELDNNFGDKYLPEIASEDIDEATMVTFGGKLRPEYGWAVVMSGGSGSGKGYVRNNRMEIDAKVIDVDRLKELYVAAAKAGKFRDLRDYDFKNPDDVAALHDIVKQKGFKDKQEEAFFKEHLRSGKLTNIIYDITGDDPRKLASVGKKLSDMGYRCSVVWVVTNREVAFMRNLKRDRVVPDKIFHATHNGVAAACASFLRGADSKYYDEAWIVFGSGNTPKDLTPEQAKELEKMGAIQLRKRGSSFDIPKDVEDKVNDVLGPMEPNPDNPQNYLTQSEFNADYDANVDRVGRGEMRILRR